MCTRADYHGALWKESLRGIAAESEQGESEQGREQVDLDIA